MCPAGHAQLLPVLVLEDQSYMACEPMPKRDKEYVNFWRSYETYLAVKTHYTSLFLTLRVLGCGSSE